MKRSLLLLGRLLDHAKLRMARSICWTETEEFPVRRNREAHFFGSAESVPIPPNGTLLPRDQRMAAFHRFRDFFYETEE